MPPYSVLYCTVFFYWASDKRLVIYCKVNLAKIPYLELTSFARDFRHIRQSCRVRIFSRRKMVYSRYGNIATYTNNRPTNFGQVIFESEPFNSRYGIFAKFTTEQVLRDKKQTNLDANWLPE